MEQGDGLFPELAENEQETKLDKVYLKAAIEALIFACGDSSIKANKIAEVLEIKEETVLELVSQLKKSFDEEDRGIVISEVAEGYQIHTKPEFFEVIAKSTEKRETKLSAAALETLAIIAFKQPITRLEIENIRGVKIDKLIYLLIDRLLVKELGRKNALGRPILYGTTDEFLMCFGLKSLEDLPSIASLLPSDDSSDEQNEININENILLDENIN